MCVHLRVCRGTGFGGLPAVHIFESGISLLGVYSKDIIIEVDNDFWVQINSIIYNNEKFCI